MDYAGTSAGPVDLRTGDDPSRSGEHANTPRSPGTLVHRPTRARLAIAPAIACSMLVHAAAVLLIPGFAPGPQLPDPAIDRPLQLRVMAPPTPAVLPTAPEQVSLPVQPAVVQPPVPRPVEPPPSRPVTQSHNHAPAKPVEPVRIPEPRPAAEAPRPTETVAATIPHADQPTVRSEPVAERTPEASPARAAQPAPVSPPAPAESRAVTEPVQTAAFSPAPLQLPHYNVAYLNNPKPAYPPAAKRLRLEGLTVVRALITTDGRVDDLRVETTSGSDLLDNAALRAVKDWRFVPAKRGTETVAHWVDVPIQFRLSD